MTSKNPTYRQVRERRDAITRDGESRAAWDLFVLTAHLWDTADLASREGLTGLAITIEHAVQVLEHATTLYALAGRDLDFSDQDSATVTANNTAEERLRTKTSALALVGVPS